MSSNVGLTTPRGSGTSGYVQRNISHLKPRDSGFGAPYPPNSSGSGGFKQRKPDKQILEHDRRRAIEVKVLEERDRLEEENEGIEEELKEKKKKGVKDEGEKEGKEDEDEKKKPEAVVLTDDEIEERLDAYRARLTKEFDEEMASRDRGTGGNDWGRRRGRDEDRDDRGKKRQFKSYQVHELAEAKIEESERLRRALGIREGFGDGGDEERNGRYSNGKDRERESSGRRW